MHEKLGRKAIRDFAKGMLIKEKSTLEGMQRAIRKLKNAPAVGSIAVENLEVHINGMGNGEGSSSV